MLKVLQYLRPKRVLEFGIGSSTDTILEADSVVSLDTVEHNPEWANKYKNKMSERFNIILEPDEFLYPYVTGRFWNYDLIFVDGIVREKVLGSILGVLAFDGVVMLHDAERKKYQSAIKSFNNIFWEDNGHTVILTNNDDTADFLRSILKENGDAVRR